MCIKEYNTYQAISKRQYYFINVKKPFFKIKQLLGILWKTYTMFYLINENENNNFKKKERFTY